MCLICFFSRLSLRLIISERAKEVEAALALEDERAECERMKQGSGGLALQTAAKKANGSDSGQSKSQSQSGGGGDSDSGSSSLFDERNGLVSISAELANAGEILSINRAACQLLGQTPGALIGQARCGDSQMGQSSMFYRQSFFSAHSTNTFLFWVPIMSTLLLNRPDFCFCTPDCAVELRAPSAHLVAIGGLSLRMCPR